MIIVTGTRLTGRSERQYEVIPRGRLGLRVRTLQSAAQFTTLAGKNLRLDPHEPRPHAGQGRRALLCYGSHHLVPGNAGRGDRVSLIEQQTGMRTYEIADLVPLQGDPGGLAAKLAGYTRGTV